MKVFRIVKLATLTVIALLVADAACLDGLCRWSVSTTVKVAYSYAIETISERQRVFSEHVRKTLPPENRPAAVPVESQPETKSDSAAAVPVSEVKADGLTEPAVVRVVIEPSNHYYRRGR